MTTFSDATWFARKDIICEEYIKIENDVKYGHTRYEILLVNLPEKCALNNTFLSL